MKSLDENFEKFWKKISFYPAHILDFRRIIKVFCLTQSKD